MDYIPKLKKIAQENNGLIKTSDPLSLGVSAHEIRKLTIDGVIEHVHQEYYQIITDNGLSDEKLIQKTGAVVSNTHPDFGVRKR